MDQLKEKYRQFRQWQEQPARIQMSDEVHRCNNCGLEFSGNYCPCCSQKADMGRVGWRSVRQGLLDIWGLGSRSLISSLWQLMWRPGYFIRDYISGKRQVSFPPVKMLFIVALIYSVVVYWLFPYVLHIELVKLDKEALKVLPFFSWWHDYFTWVSLLMSMIFILPTWVLFRYAPRYPYHTIPEGFFIQVLMSVMLIVISGVFRLLFIKNSYFCFAVFCLYYYVVYRQLFGYGVWGTIWRQLLMWISFSFLFLGMLLLTGGFSYKEPEAATMSKMAGYQLGLAFFSFALPIVVLLIGFMLNRTARKRFPKTE